ncbi:MAG: lipoyl protein ligase domain-containing protein [Pseudomonadota bacterium]
MSSERETWRIIDTGVRRAAENMALDRAILEAHQEGEAPHTLRFLQFRPCALVGFHQSVSQELRTDYCAENGIDIQRRITGGGAIYFDETQIGWELFLNKQRLGTADMGAIAERICNAAAEGMRRLGVDAYFRPRNDIEVDGRKISGTGGAFDGDSIIYQGTLLVEFDVGRMMRVLQIPAEKLSDKAIESAQDRVANLKTLLGEAPAMELVKKHIGEAIAEAFDVEMEEVDNLTHREEQLYREALDEIDSDEWVYQIDHGADAAPTVESITRSDGGTMRAHVWVDRNRGMIKQVMLTGDFFVNPKRMVLDLEGALKETPLAKLRESVNAFFDEYPVEMLQLTREDFITAIEAALTRLDDADAVRSGGQGA